MATLDELVATVKDLVAAHSVYPPLKELAQQWLDAEGTAAQANLTALLKNALKEDITTIDALISLTESEMGAKIFGADTAKKMAEQAHKVKEAGGKYCFCPACTAGVKILELLGEPV